MWGEGGDAGKAGYVQLLHADEASRYLVEYLTPPPYTLAPARRTPRQGPKISFPPRCFAPPSPSLEIEPPPPPDTSSRPASAVPSPLMSSPRVPHSPPTIWCNDCEGEIPPTEVKIQGPAGNYFHVQCPSDRGKCHKCRLEIRNDTQHMQGQTINGVSLHVSCERASLKRITCDSCEAEIPATESAVTSLWGDLFHVQCPSDRNNCHQCRLEIKLWPPDMQGKNSKGVSRHTSCVRAALVIFGPAAHYRCSCLTNELESHDQHHVNCPRRETHRSLGTKLPSWSSLTEAVD